MRAPLDHEPIRLAHGCAGSTTRTFPGRRRQKDVLVRGVVGSPRGGGPLPHISRDVVEVVAIRRKMRDRRRSGEAVRVLVLERKRSVPRVRHNPALRHELVSPRVGGSVKAAAGGVFPFLFCGQPLLGPLGVRTGVLQPDVHHGVLFLPDHIGRRAFWVLPICARHPVPPLRPVVQGNRARCRHEHLGSGYEQSRGRRPGSPVRRASARRPSRNSWQRRTCEIPRWSPDARRTTGGRLRPIAPDVPRGRNRWTPCETHPRGRATCH